MKKAERKKTEGRKAERGERERGRQGELIRSREVTARKQRRVCEVGGRRGREKEEEEEEEEQGILHFLSLLQI